MILAPVIGYKASGKSNFTLAWLSSAKHATRLINPDHPGQVDGWHVTHDYGQRMLGTVVLNPPKNRPFKVTNLLRQLARMHRLDVQCVIFEWEFNASNFGRLWALYPQDIFLMLHCRTPMETCANRIVIDNLQRKSPPYFDINEFYKQCRKQDAALKAVQEHTHTCEILHGVPAETSIAKCKDYLMTSLKLHG